MAHIYSTWHLFLVTNGPLGPFFSEAGQNTGWIILVILNGYKFSLDNDHNINQDSSG